MTPTGTPASASRSIASSRRAGVGARGSIFRAISRSSVVTETNTFTRPLLRHRRQQIEVAQNQVRFRYDPNGMARPREHLEDRARHAILTLDRLIRVGIGSQRDHARSIFRRRQLLLEQGRRAILDEQLALEVEPCGETEIGMARPGVAVNATVFAAAIGVDRPVERNVGRFVLRDDRARPLERHFRLQRGNGLVALPAVVEILSLDDLETAGRVRGRAAAAPEIGGGESIAEARAELVSDREALLIIEESAWDVDMAFDRNK